MIWDSWERSCAKEAEVTRQKRGCFSCSTYRMESYSRAWCSGWEGLSSWANSVSLSFRLTRSWPDTSRFLMCWTAPLASPSSCVPFGATCNMIEVYTMCDWTTSRSFGTPDSFLLTCIVIAVKLHLLIQYQSGSRFLFEVDGDPTATFIPANHWLYFLPLIEPSTKPHLTSCRLLYPQTASVLLPSETL